MERKSCVGDNIGKPPDIKDIQQDKENLLESWTETSLSSRIAQKWGKLPSTSLFYLHSPSTSIAHKESLSDENDKNRIDLEELLHSTKSLSISDSRYPFKDEKSTNHRQQLLLDTPPSFVTPYCVELQQVEETIVLRKFKRNRENLLKQLFAFYNEKVFSNQLKENLVNVCWSKSLNTTAGKTCFQQRRLDDGQIERVAHIQISVKVVDRGERLISTLAHEMCHAGQWILGGVSKPPHGREFQKWSEEFKKRLSFVQVNVKHSYAIVYKYNYNCQSCGLQYGRHSKSIDTSRQRCGRCKGQLALQML